MRPSPTKAGVLVTTLNGASVCAACAQATRVYEAELSVDGTRIAFLYSICGEVTSATVEETDAVVTVSPLRSGPLIVLVSNDCQDRVVVQLSEPLGDRTVVNGPTGEVVIVDDLNWKTWDFSKEPDENGNMSMPAIGVCQTRVLDPLR